MYPLHPLRPKPICHTPCSYQVTMAHAVSVCSKIGGYAKILTFFHGEKMFFWLGFSSAIQRFPTDRWKTGMHIQSIQRVIPEFHDILLEFSHNFPISSLTMVPFTIGFTSCFTKQRWRCASWSLLQPPSRGGRSKEPAALLLLEAWKFCVGSAEADGRRKMARCNEM